MSAPLPAELKEFMRKLAREAVREVMIEMLGGVQPNTPDQWIDLEDAWEKLGYPSYSALYKTVQSGLFREGKEVRDRRKPGAKNAKWQINIELANKRLMQAGEKRSRR
ncbi:MULTISPECIES: hypothetical protein [Leptolyngbya]|uniref:hypothetical protein n=1 Tax=Leptolyngbya TaxID=47251 RepID=UPI001681DD22|nr:hypothetical protein [Leptolyngbya sp. FACHB-1624]MBD1856592.1 hypothetical protein [Leptolyngbya sp. FACHB-1624]